MARLSVLSDQVRSLVRGELVPLYLATGSVQSLCQRLNEALRARGSDATLHPNRLHAILSTDPGRSVNTATLDLLREAARLAAGEDPGAVAEAALRAAAQLRPAIRFGGPSRDLARLPDAVRDWVVASAPPGEAPVDPLEAFLQDCWNGEETLGELRGGLGARALLKLPVPLGGGEAVPLWGEDLRALRAAVASLRRDLSALPARGRHAALRAALFDRDFTGVPNRVLSRLEWLLDEGALDARLMEVPPGRFRSPEAAAERAREAARNPWSLYDKPGFREVSERLDAELEAALDAMDAAIDGGAAPGDAAMRAHDRVLAAMDGPANIGYGAADTEGRSRLAGEITRHLLERHGVEASPEDGWGARPRRAA